ncbi:hypothetical protein BDV37DRAFT_278097 [Aspergillus pseudonomiae]|uniref:Uncharacterized protein n=1 Tax=Aspergillus pseudonomiae TaxID=1506151 RepID=A0A5N7DRM4_9EURO|nr:uncharacterized protein BDV37DRAFT_278097 [Aspergillus pseudonomiae]KAE8409120.1 hypothetical protein BDV37DRAFT_278097 [Aspergillus pseudonomiae]
MPAGLKWTLIKPLGIPQKTMNMPRVSANYIASETNQKILAVERYLKLLKFLFPEESMQTSHIWQDDLHAEDIFVNPIDPTLHDHTVEPYILDYDGPPLDGLFDRAKLVDIRALFYDKLESIANYKTISLFTNISLVSLYGHLIHKRIPQLFKALEFRENMCFELLLFARYLLLNGEATYLALLADQQRQSWRDIPRLKDGDKNSLICFSADMLHRIDVDHTGAHFGLELMQGAQAMVRKKFFYASGLVSHEEFSEAQQIIPRVKAEFIQKHARNADGALELERA